MKSLAIGFYRSWACHRGRRGRRRRRRKMDCLNLSDWNYPDTMLGIPINSTTLFLYPSLLLSFYFLPWSFSSRLSHLFANPGTSSSKFAATIFHSECGGARIGGLPSSWLSCARPRSHAVSTRVNFNSLSDDPRSDLLNIRRPLLVRRWIYSESSLISVRMWSWHPIIIIMLIVDSFNF